ncbi:MULTISPECIES: amidohydrolase family protein [unclassified Sporosarcina]|uniref:amidohydrolase family protein n=1 Tax=unclassified Sporosarcina TaxID=2647733 RepID=UPI00117C7F09|nr:MULTISPECIES: amidohydrolase family protein [unclassified Sporosarcina]
MAENTGSIEIGKYADFAVLDQDPTRIDPMKIKDISVISTFINGKNVYKKDRVECSRSGGVKHTN